MGPFSMDTANFFHGHNYHVALFGDKIVQGGMMMRLNQHFKKDRPHNLAPLQLEVMFTPNDGHRLWDDRAIREVRNDDAEEVQEVEPVDDDDDDDDDVEVVGVFGPTKVEVEAVDVGSDDDDDVKVVGVSRPTPNRPTPYKEEVKKEEKEAVDVGDDDDVVVVGVVHAEAVKEEEEKSSWV